MGVALGKVSRIEVRRSVESWGGWRWVAGVDAKGFKSDSDIFSSFSFVSLGLDPL